MSARDNILNKLKASLKETTPIANDFNEALVTTPWTYPTTAEKIKQLTTVMEAVHTKIYCVKQADWLNTLAECLINKQLNNLLYAPQSIWGATIEHYWQSHTHLPELKVYDRPIEEWKLQLFNDIDASITSTKGAIAATGSLILWPSPIEPRLMSLVPPVHFAVLKASEIVNNFYEAQQRLNWKENTPTNALLISGPSKTADIEQVMAYGAHGPKDLIVMLLEDA